jgi:putative ABC transport system ATP-binding protein
MTPVIAVRDLTKSYTVGDLKVPALRGVTLDVAAGDFVALTGPSGSGKSTLMHLLGCLDRPTSGQYVLDGQDVSALDKRALAHVRNHAIGFVFQGFNLLSRTSALENVELPMLYRRGIGAKERHERWPRSASAIGWTTIRTSSRADSSSASPSPAPSSTSRRCCSPTSRPATSTRARASR